MRYVKVQAPDFSGGSFVVPLEEVGTAVTDNFVGGDLGSTLVLTLVEMTEEEYNNLPEFTGF